MTAVVTNEQRVYGPGSDASYFQDIALASLTSVTGASEARERLFQYARELDVEIGNRSPEGLRAKECEQEYRRGGGVVEARSGATSTTVAGFTTPIWMTEHWAAYRAPIKAFTNQTTKLPLTPYGLQINVPSFTGLTTNAQQNSENSGITVNVPTGSDIVVNLVTIAAQVPLSQQLFDRGGMSGLAFDMIIGKQLLQNQDAAVDLYVINQALGNAYTTTYSSSASIPNFLSDLALAREGLSDTVGTRLLATHLFTTTDQFGYWSHQTASTAGVPFIQPDSSAIVLAQSQGDPKWESWMGVHLGTLAWHSDDNIPALSGNTQLLVCRPQEIYTFDGQNFTFAYPETGAQTLTVQVGLKTYVGAVVRFPKAIAAITSAAYPVTNV